MTPKQSPKPVPATFRPSSDGIMKMMKKKLQPLPTQVNPTQVNKIPKTDTEGMRKFLKWRSTVKDKRLV